MDITLDVVGCVNASYPLFDKHPKEFTMIVVTGLVCGTIITGMKIYYNEKGRD